MRRAAALLLGLCLLWPAAPATAADRAPTDRAPTGWASTGPGTTGGAGGRTWTVHTRAELKAALANDGDPTAPKVIRVHGDINGHESDDGSLLGEQDYAPGDDLGRIHVLLRARTVPPGPTPASTTASGSGSCGRPGRTRRRRRSSSPCRATPRWSAPAMDARLLGGCVLTVNTGSNIIVRNLHLEAPVDHFTNWSPDDGAQGNGTPGSTP